MSVLLWELLLIPHRTSSPRCAEQSVYKFKQKYQINNGCLVLQRNTVALNSPPTISAVSSAFDDQAIIITVALRFIIIII